MQHALIRTEEWLSVRLLQAQHHTSKTKQKPYPF